MGRNKEKVETENKQHKETKANHVGLPLKFKSIIFVAAMIVLTAATTIIVAMPKVRQLMEDTTKNYMYDLAETNGRVLDLEVYSYGVGVGLSAEKLEELFQNVEVKGVSGSYAYVVTPDGNMC